MFKLKEKNARVSTEIIAGLTTFFTMAYIIFVNPELLSLGDQKVYSGVFVATCLASFFGTMLMALLANLPFALAPGMGLNAFFAFTVMAANGYTYPQALAIVFLSGLLFILITAIGLREAIVKAIPKSLKIAISVGIGLFIAFIGFQNVGFVVNSDATLVDLFPAKNILTGDAAAYVAIMCFVGMLIIGMLNRFKVPGAILLGMIAASALYWAIGVPTGIVAFPQAGIDFASIGTQFKDWAEVSFGAAFTEGFKGLFAGKSVWDAVLAVCVIILSFSFVDMFDTIGTLIGTATKANMLDEKGELPNMKNAMFADAIATSVGAVCGTSTVTTYVESSAGIAAGGKTGLTAFTTAICFLAALLLAPFTGFIPTAATSAALIYVGVLMMSTIKDLEWDDVTESLPAFMCIASMPFTYSRANGIFIGIITHVLLKAISLKFKDISVIEIILAGLFILKFLFV